MNWIKKIFRSGSHQETQHPSREEAMLKKLAESISQCNLEIKKAGEEIEQIGKWAAEAMLEVFQVPHKFWYNEIANYEEIKQLADNLSVDPKVTSKCDEVISGYSEQVKLREAKIVLYNTLIEKYSKTKEKMERIKKRGDDELATMAKINALEKHSQRIEQLRNSPENLIDHIEGSNNLELIKNEVKDVIDEFEISEEVKTSLEEIDHQFHSGKYSSSAQPAIDEIEKLVEKIKKQD
jgi:uncharacterized phage infection (PIP) family protein YhgE